MVSMNNIISNRIYDKRNKAGYKIGWRNMRKQERANALDKIKIFLLSTCKTCSLTAWAVANMNINNLPRSANILDRLTTEGYTAGQDYPGELRFVKNWIKKYCYSSKK